MASRQGGKLKPLKAAKKDKKELDEEDVAFQARKKAEEAALKAARDKATKGETVSCDVVLWLGGTDPRTPMQAELRVAASRSLARSSGCIYPSRPGRTTARTPHAASIYLCGSIFCSVRTRSRCCTPHLGCTIDMFFREIERRSDITFVSASSTTIATQAAQNAKERGKFVAR
ncbi:hypothetical protein VTO73DRAFT_13273 [Trametes versicolor]